MRTYLFHFERPSPELCRINHRCVRTLATRRVPSGSSARQADLDARACTCVNMPLGRLSTRHCLTSGTEVRIRGEVWRGLIAMQKFPWRILSFLRCSPAPHSILRSREGGGAMGGGGGAFPCQFSSLHIQYVHAHGYRSYRQVVINLWNR